MDSRARKEGRKENVRRRHEGRRGRCKLPAIKVSDGNKFEIEAESRTETGKNVGDERG